jgi:hypothetical protein
MVVGLRAGIRAVRGEDAPGSKREDAPGSKREDAPERRGETVSAVAPEALAPLTTGLNPSRLRRWRRSRPTCIRRAGDYQFAYAATSSSRLLATQSKSS